MVSLEWFKIGFPGEIVKMEERRKIPEITLYKFSAFYHRPSSTPH